MYIMIQYFYPPGILRKIDENVALFRQILQEKFRKNWKNTYVIGLAYSYSSFNI